MLVEVLRKLWVGIVIDMITSIWEQYETLAPSQHGFRRRRGTDTALIEVINILEHAQETDSWDIKRAFESVTRPLMDLAWCWLGVPPDVARWLAYMDLGGPVTVCTPLALHQLGPRGRFPPRGSPEDLSFTCGMGTPLGDVSSPSA